MSSAENFTQSAKHLIYHMKNLRVVMVMADFLRIMPKYCYNWRHQCEKDKKVEFVIHSCQENLIKHSI